ncbi:MAG: cytochrome-c peroxidase [Betaproteobacteria bacterium]|nr:cytochrome-c peroxidase [Betaproteobacteria bacterium]
MTSSHNPSKSHDTLQLSTLPTALASQNRYSFRLFKWATKVCAILAVALAPAVAVRADDDVSGNAKLNAMLKSVLQQAGFTGRIDSTLEARLGRAINPRLAELGQLLFFDRSGGLNNDNTCAGCHAPASGFGDTQSIAIGVQNNLIVGPGRKGPRNQRRTPSVVNTVFYPPHVERPIFRAIG